VNQKEQGFKKLTLLVAIFMTAWACHGQFVTSGQIHYERRTNLQKINQEHLPEWMRNYIAKEKFKIDKFVLRFDEYKSGFVPSNPPSNDFRETVTIKNAVYSNHQTYDRLTVMDVMGQSIFIRDTVNKITWKMTDDTRNLAGYNCKMAFFQKDSSMTIYAWYAEELIPSVGPETFSGLPGAILGLAIEDGSVVYFAKSVETQEMTDKELTYDTKKNKVYTKQGIKDDILKRMGSSERIQELIDAYFMWY